jgi:hypothetical protein
MSETHQIAGAPQGEPLAADRVGARVRVPLSGGAPSPRWSRALGAQLTNELSGHAAVGHLRLGELVQGTDLVLDGVEEREAPLLSHALQRAIDATNAACSDETLPSANVSRPEAEAIARKLRNE